jgi:hypothetical protein
VHLTFDALAFVAPALDAPALDAPAFDASVFDASGLEACSGPSTRNSTRMVARINVADIPFRNSMRENLLVGGRLIAPPAGASPALSSFPSLKQR